ncbi:MAG: alanyl-tRNA synthetase [Candidatus Saccharibacteria bacterium]|nr:alanyl-tRNA synthetase [Candidatus Saccharibacteria bacterium]
MDAQTIRKKYLQFFEERGHAVIPRALLVPNNDPTTLFTGSGMQPMIPYLLGESHQNGNRLVNSQVCLRAQDIDEVGDESHTTTFEMLGNWSLGDYFKTEQVQWIAEFLFDVVGLDPARVYVSCYIGNEKYGIPRDNQAIELWTKEFEKRGIEAKVVELGSAENGDKLGMQGGRIFLYDGKENWWSRNGNEEGTLIGDPCGPDSEMFFDFGEQYHDEAKWGKPHPASDSPRFFEIGNNVFMGYKKVADDKFEELTAPNIDHGSGLERIAAAVIDSPDVYRISLLWPIIEKLQKLSGKDYESHTNAMRVIADHLHGAVFLGVDGIVPSNKEQGYVMRRLVRRAIRYAFDLGIEQNFLEQVVPVITDLYHEDFPEVAAKRDEVIAILTKEEKVFRQTLRKGVKELKKMAEGGKLDGNHIFVLYDTYGFPVELSVEEAFMQGIDTSETWREEFDARMAEQRNRSQTAAKGTFKGGLGGQTQQHKKYHTATHLMYQALRDVLGNHVIQRGSNITEERLRFDFSHDTKVTPEQIKQVEEIVNEQIGKDLKVSWAEYPTEEATGPLGALGQFGDRYGDTVKVYKMIADGADKPFSFEICGGPHVDHTHQLLEDGKRFKILKEEASSAGIRRIKAVLQ